MEFTNSFTVHSPLPVVWEFLLNAREVAPCVPGAEITDEIDETHYNGILKFKLGPMSMSFKGELEMRPNETDRTITLFAKGQGLKGVGNASGEITAQLKDGSEPDTTDVEILSKVTVTGRIAQFGRGIMQDVAGKQLTAFATCLEQKLAQRQSAPSA